MNFSALFIRRPIGTVLLTIALALAGLISYQFLPVSPLPQVEFPSIEVQAALPGASPEIMASAVATPLERQFGRIAGLNEMTSTSFLGSTRITLQFDLSRNINAAARDVQAAINAARGQLPANLPNTPFYRKSNPADSPVVILALPSEIVGRARMYDMASSILQQKLSQVPGVGRVIVGGGALPAVRVDVNPTVLHSYGLSLEDVRAALSTANANRPKGEIADNSGRAWTLNTTDQLLQAADYQPVIISYRQGAAVRLADVAEVVDASEDIRNTGVVNGKPAILLLVWRQPGANILATVDRVRAILPQLQAAIPPTVTLVDAVDRTTTIRASVHDVQRTLALSILLVILVVFVFFRTVRIAIIPSVVVPVSLIGTCGAMYLLGAHSHEGHGWLYRANEWVFQRILRLYEVTLAWVLRHQFLMLLVTVATVYVTVRLYINIPKGFFPQQDTGQIFGQIQADQSSSFQSMRQILQQFVTLVGEDPAVDNVLGFTGGGYGGSVNTARMFVALKPLKERQISADQ